MSHLLADRVKDTTTTTGTGSVTLAGAPPTGFRSFASALAVNDTTYYVIVGGAEWEVGLGTLTASTTLARTTVLASSNAGSLVTFSAGTKDVFATGPAGRLLALDHQLKVVLPTTTGSTPPPATFMGLGVVNEDGFERMDLTSSDGWATRIGRDTLVICQNKEGSTISKGDWVYAFGGAANKITVKKARANADSTMPAIGVVVDASITNNSYGRILFGGVITGVNTSAFTDGDRLFLSFTTAGAVANTAPTGGFKQRVGICLNAHASTGSILVAPVGTSPRQDAAGYLQLYDNTGTPATPADGVTLFSRAIAGRRLPAYVGPSGLDTALQPFLSRNKVAFFSPFPGLTTLTGWGMTPAATGTATAKTGASTNIHTQTPGVDILVTTAATTAVAGYRLASAAAALSIWRGNAAGFGGFTHIVRFSPATGGTVTTGRCFVGLSNLTAAPTDVDPATLLNMVGVGFNKSVNANWRIYGNDNTGTAGSYDTGIAAPTTDRPGLYEVAIFAPPNGSSITVRFTDVGTGQSFEQVITASADLPPATTFLAGRGYHSVGGTSSVVGLTIFSIYHESDL